jgi:cytochrome P450
MTRSEPDRGEASPGNVATDPPAQAFPILDAFDAIAARQDDPRESAAAQFQFVMNQIRVNGPAFFAELRDGRPILSMPTATLVARFADVEEILHREHVFSVKPYLGRMTGVIGPFVLSQDLTPAYDHDISVMRLVARREDLDRVRSIVARHASAIVDEILGRGGPADIVRSLTRGVPLRLAEEYFGFAAEDDARMLGWARACFREFFINILDDPGIRAPAVEAGAEMRARLDTLIAGRRAATGAPVDDVLGRLIALRAAEGGAVLDDEDIRRTLTGLVIGMIETTSQAAVQALIVLLSRPDMLARASAAAADDEDDALAGLVFEALRFSPINPMVVRVAKEDYGLAVGQPCETLIRAGTTVFALTWSAMFDPRVLPAPEEFRPKRPDHHYLHFATGFHACFGRYVSRVQIPEILKPLLRLKGLRPVGSVVYDGTFPDRLEVAADT